MIAACYRRDEAQNPELFADALALVLGDYPAEIVQVAVDPRTGVIERFPMGLPNVGQIKQFLDDLMTRRDRLQHYAALPKPPRPVRRAPQKAAPNLFVPAEDRRYEAMRKMAEKEPGRAQFGNHVCSDNVERAGVWVPLGWWEAPDAAAKLEPLPMPTTLSKELAAQMGIPHGHVEDHQGQ